MIPMMDASDIDQAESEIGMKCEQLLTPLTRRLRQRPHEMFAIDNGAYAKFDAKAFLSLLKREEASIPQCRFVAAPDVVGDARRTLEVFDFWVPKLSGWRIALVAQDGQENLPIPWGSISAIFIGGTTDWKLSKYAAAIVKAAVAMGKWCHVGRINTPGRFEYFEKLGADSMDGTGLARFSDMRHKIHNNRINPKLFDDNSA